MITEILTNRDFEVISIRDIIYEAYKNGDLCYKIYKSQGKICIESFGDYSIGSIAYVKIGRAHV